MKTKSLLLPIVLALSVAVAGCGILPAPPTPPTPPGLPAPPKPPAP